jgi:protein O-GlcNAc transferase
MTLSDGDLEKLQQAFEEAVGKHRNGDIKAAHVIYQKVHQAIPDHSEVLHLLGVVALQQGEGASAEGFLLQAIALEPKNSKYLNNLGNSYYLQRKFQLAADIYQRASDIDIEDVDPRYNLGTALYELGNFGDAVNNFKIVLAKNVDHHLARLNLGVCFKDLKQYSKASDCFQNILDSDPGHFDAAVNLASVKLATQDWDDASALFERARELQPEHAGIQLELLKLAQRACDFDSVSDYNAGLAKLLPDSVAHTKDWQFLASLAYQNIFSPLAKETLDQVQQRFDELVSPEQALPRALPQTDKIRIGYMASNFGDHPVGHVTSALFQNLDRSKFEVFGFSLVDRTSELQNFAEDLKGNFDAFYQIGTLTPRQAAQKISDLGVQILTDLDGFMSSKGLRIQAYRPAPVQLYWLGHAGGVGQSYIDYLIADRNVLPESEQNNYRDDILYLPDIYHSAASHPISSELPDRASFGLPDTDPVFCAFNNTEKINRRVFEAWMVILKKTPGSVLWLSSMRGWPRLADNLKKHAEALGVAGERIVFSNRISAKEDHLARHRHACVFLDTLTLNASTTALDALWTGLPVLAVTGDDFPSRISQTMLKAVGMDEMICPDVSNYIARAISIATDKTEERRLKDKLANNLANFPLFDVERFARNLEQVYQDLVTQ